MACAGKISIEAWWLPGQFKPCPYIKNKPEPASAIKNMETRLHELHKVPDRDLKHYFENYPETGRKK
jgi:hypothetical protein